MPSFLIYPDPSGDFGLLALKILTAHATLRKTKELKILQSVKRMKDSITGLPNLHDHFFKNSHHGKHLCLGLSVLGPSIEDLRQQSLLLSDTKTKTLLSVHLVQRIVGSILETLERFHYHRFIHCGLLSSSFHTHLIPSKKLTHIIST